MFRLLLQEAARNQWWKVGVEHSRFFKARIQEVLNVLPDGITIRPDNHTTTYRSIVSQFSFTYYLVVPHGKIVVVVDDLLDILFFVKHTSPFLSSINPR